MGALLMLLVYAWPHAGAADPLEARFPPPTGATRVEVAADGFGAFLRRLPLKPAGSEVHLFDGTRKPRQDVHAAVVDLDVPPRDLQQCADAVMRLWAEYGYARGGRIAFHPEPGRATALTFDARSRDRKAFGKWLIKVFADAGSASLQAELKPVAGAVEPGDVLIQGGYPGHAVLVLDVATSTDGRRWLLLGQSYMPAQEFHVLANPSGDGARGHGPWYDAAALATASGLATPEWRPFKASDVRRFAK